MNDRKEIECARLAFEAKRDVARQRLGALYAKRFDGPLSGASLWPKRSIGLAQFLMLPVSAVVVLLLAIVTPLAYARHLIDIRRSANLLQLRIHEVFDPAQFKAPRAKTLNALWASCELPDGLGLDEGATLLQKWLEILYGGDIAGSTNCATRASDIAKEQIEANRPYYEGDDSPHFHFAFPIDSLLHRLTEELPAYVAQPEKGHGVRERRDVHF